MHLNAKHDFWEQELQKSLFFFFAENRPIFVRFWNTILDKVIYEYREINMEERNMQEQEKAHAP